MILYSLALALGLILSAPWWLFRMATTQRYREGLRDRLGIVPASLRTAAAGKQVLWLHAVSVGELLAATRLVTELESALGPGWLIAISTTTRTGQSLARERFGAARVFYMPLDFAFSIRAYLRALHPAAIILMESELWPRLLDEAQRQNIPTVVANARMSDRSFARAIKFKPLWSRVLRKATLFLAQSNQDAQRLASLGVSNVRTTGNLKYDVRSPSHAPIAQRILAAAAGRPIIVAGSVVADRGAGRWEDSFAIEAWAAGAGPHNNALLVLAPRHPETFKHAEALAKPFLYLRASDWSSDPDPRYTITSTELEIILLDTVGDLASTYGIATVAFVGGSLVDRGGHNPLEPARFGVPTTMGPSFENFRDIVGRLQAAEAIRIVADENELSQTWLDLLAHRDAAQQMGQRAHSVFQSQQGATTRAVEAILALLPQQVQP